MTDDHDAIRFRSNVSTINQCLLKVPGHFFRMHQATLGECIRHLSCSRCVANSRHAQSRLTDLHQPHYIVMVQFLQDGDLSVDLLQGQRGFERGGSLRWRQAAWNHSQQGRDPVSGGAKPGRTRLHKRHIVCFFHLRRNPCCLISFFFDTTFIAWTQGGKAHGDHAATMNSERGELECRRLKLT